MSSTDNHHGAADSAAMGPVARIVAALDEIDDTDLATLDPAGVAQVLADVEHVQRVTGAVAASLLAQVHRDGLHQADGHRSPRTMIRHVGRLSGGEAAARDRVARALVALPDTAAAYRSGEIGACQVRRLARTHANPRVRDLLPGAETHLLDIARTQSYQWFADAVTAWERLADQDGTIDHDSRAEDARVRTTPDGMTELTVRLRSGRGAITNEIFQHYLAAETAADWDAARAEWGDDASWERLPRTDAERRTDAFMAMVLDAAATPPDARDPRITIDLLIGHDEFLRQVALLAGDHAPAAAPQTADPLPTARTAADGTPVDPWDVAALATGADLRRVVIGADSSVVDLGRRSRCFTGSARDAVMLRHPRCAWAGCHTPTRHCQADHATPHSHGGPTTPANGQPLCGHHNRHKHTHRYRVWCDPGGRWHTTRPDGTEV